MFARLTTTRNESNHGPSSSVGLGQTSTSSVEGPSVAGGLSARTCGGPLPGGAWSPGKGIAWGLLAFLLTIWGGLPSAAAQFELFSGSGNDPFAVPNDPITLSATFQPIANTQQAVLEVHATIAPGYHVYSMTQKEGLPSTVTIKDKSVQRIGEFVASQAPVIHPPTIDIPYETETYEGQVSWRALIEFPEGKNPADQRLALNYNGLACNDSACNPYRTDLTAKAGAPVDKVPADLLASATTADNASTNETKETREAVLPDGKESIEAGHATLTGWVNASAIKPGETVELVIRADLAKGYHTYQYLRPTEDANAYGPSYMGALGVSGTEKSILDFQFAQPKANKETHLGELDIPQYDDSVEWTLSFQVPKDPGSDRLVLHGVMQSQTCDHQGCDVPVQLQWHVALSLANESSKGRTPLVWSELESKARTLLTDNEKAEAFLDGLQSPAATEVLEQQAESANQFAGGSQYDVAKLQPQPFQNADQFSLIAILGIALIGGFILNFMPCVLPVIGLKILSLVEQAGESRAKAISFNTVYVLGMLSVFWILAFLISSKELGGWGSQFSSTLFNITFAGVVFAMALSYLEIWEITLPSFVGMQGSKLEQKEGWMGTFFKGAVTTILATPCSGPGLATALAWCADKPPSIIFLVFTFLGLGMGLPYIVVAIFPPLISFLPKPGPWMNTFKQVMGFVLLGTVAFFLSYVELQYLFPTICFLMVVWFACWLVGRLTYSSTATTWLSTWATSIAIILFSSYFIFGWQVSNRMNDLLGGNFNERFASDWNLMASQQYRVNSFVTRELNKRGGIPGSVGATMVSNQSTNDGNSDQEHGTITWVPYSLQALEYYTNGDEPRTVFIDFTAEWCVNCKVFERTVLHSDGISRRLKSENVVAMIADKTHFNEEIDKLLEKLGGGNQIPLYAIFPESDPYRPIVMDGTSISIDNVNSVLDQAGVPGISDLPDVSEAPPAMVDQDPPMLLDEENGLPVPTETVGAVKASADNAM